MACGTVVTGLFLIVLSSWGEFHVVHSSGTTPYIQDIFIARCLDFKETLDPSLSKNCMRLWYLFFTAFAGKLPCEVSAEDYDQFALEAAYDLPANKHMFWEGVYEFVHQMSYKGTRYTAASDTLSGYLADRLVWCGNKDGINYNHCPGFGTCENEVQRSFWQSISRVFAAEAHGEVFIMVNGTTGRAHSKTSIFAEYELKNLMPSRVTKVTAFVVSRLGSQVREKCDCSDCTIRQLEEDVKQQGLQFACEDNPLEVMYMLCVDSPNDPQCKKLVSSGNQMKQQILLVILLSTIMTLW